MRAVVFDGVGAVRLANVPEPLLETSGDAIVRVSHTAICGSDLHLVHGKVPIDAGETLGHEAVGVVEDVGDAVSRFSVGDPVVVAFNIACGRCWFCRRGETQLCDDFRNLGAGRFGGGLPGAQAELVRVPAADHNLLGVPGGLEPERAMFAGDILTTAYYAAALAQPAPEETLAVVGAGPVGNLCVQAARALGAGTVLALDREPERLALAARAGAVPIDVRAQHPQAAVDERTEGRGADVVIEAVGSIEGFETAVDVSRRGGRVVVLGVYAGETVEAQVGVWWARALTLRFAGVCPVHAWWESAIAAVVDGRIDPDPIVSHRLPLDEAVEGYALFDRHEATKVVLVP
ncbi:MAG: alcohol dehydrogenase catalytic domain-containing protein [Actinomycetota bacterium]